MRRTPQPRQAGSVGRLAPPPRRRRLAPLPRAPRPPARLRKDPDAQFLLAVNLQVPGRPDAYNSVFYFAADAPIPPDSLLGRFVYGDDAYRNARFKIVNRIVKGPWLVRATVSNYGA
ncbi:hypothetical protein ZWY2020_025650 [Hordeum vulgare]|nr:hypothetical protein ZWY2020_025650 [Hordeum vulgare]